MISRITHAFSSLNSIAISSRRVRTARTPVSARPLRSPTMLVASRITGCPLAAAGGEETDQRTGGRGDPDRTPRVAAHIRIGARDGHLRAVLDRLLDLAELLLGGIELGRDLGLHLVDLRGALFLHGLQKLLGFGDDVLDIASHLVGLRGGAAHGGGLLWQRSCKIARGSRGVPSSRRG